MQRRGLGLFAAVVLIAGCGSGTSTGSACDKIVQGYSDYATKASACGVTIPVGSFDKASCEAAFNGSGCTSADKQLWADFGSCLSALPTCTAGNITPFTNAVVACTNKLNGLSASCN
ncbi:MAG TPA: hypothetical protein VLT82_02290 [Myxococcaceae bacterium]|nr:hypothetical protein [Myxococcaceae bacterium]